MAREQDSDQLFYIMTAYTHFPHYNWISFCNTLGQCLSKGGELSQGVGVGERWGSCTRKAQLDGGSSGGLWSSVLTPVLNIFQGSVCNDREDLRVTFSNDGTMHDGLPHPPRHRTTLSLGLLCWSTLGLHQNAPPQAKALPLLTQWERYKDLGSDSFRAPSGNCSQPLPGRSALSLFSQHKP